MKAKTQYACQHCGYVSAKWIGRCPSCQQWNSLVEERASPPEIRAKSWDSTPQLFDEISGAETPRQPTGIAEFDRVLGGGVVAGALMLLGGDPGVGKSTLMLDVAARLSSRMKVLYASGEESAQQIRMRGERLNICNGALHIYAEMCVEKILSAAESLEAAVLVIDSVQTT